MSHALGTTLDMNSSSNNVQTVMRFVLNLLYNAWRVLSSVVALVKVTSTIFDHLSTNRIWRCFAQSSRMIYIVREYQKWFLDAFFGYIGYRDLQYSQYLILLSEGGIIDLCSYLHGGSWHILILNISSYMKFIPKSPPHHRERCSKHCRCKEAAI